MELFSKFLDEKEEEDVELQLFRFLGLLISLLP